MTAASPRPGRPVRGSSTGRPIMAALDLLGRRWILRILWELRAGPLGFRDLQRRCDDMSSSVLSDRLRDLQAAGLVARTDGDLHTLTDTGQALGTAIGPLSEWADTWAAQLDAPA